MRVGDIEPVCTGLECLCVHCGFHTLSNLFMLCDAQFFSITLSAVCLETATDELAGVAQPPHSHRVRARVVSTASFWGCVLWPLSMPSVWHSSTCMGRASRRSPDRLAGPRVDLGRTWDKEIQGRVRSTGSRGGAALIVSLFSYYIHIVLQYPVIPERGWVSLSAGHVVSWCVASGSASSIVRVRP